MPCFVSHANYMLEDRLCNRQLYNAHYLCKSLNWSWRNKKWLHLPIR